jgi:hypothetical protein
MVIGVVDDGGLKTRGAAGGMTAVGWDPRAAATAAAGQRLGHHEIDGDPRGREPTARLWIGEVAVKARGGHRVIQERVVDERPGIDGEVGVLGCLGQRDLGTAGVQVYGLGADEHEGLALLGQGVERVE